MAASINLYKKISRKVTLDITTTVIPRKNLNL